MSTTAAAADTPAAQPRLTNTVIAGWGLGSFASSTMFQATSVYLLHFLVEYVGLAAALAGLIFSLTKLYDAVIDPLIGGVSDRTRTRWGRRRPYIALGGVICSISFILMFNLPRSLDPTTGIVLAAAALLLNTTGYAILSIPYLAMPAEMTRDPKKRTTIVSYRVIGIALGQIFGSSVAAWIIGAFGGGARGHSLMSFVLGATILTFALTCFHLTAKAPSFPIVPQPRLSFKEKVATVLGNHPFAMLILVKIFNLISLNFYFGVLPFLFISVLRMDYKALGLYFLIQGPCIILTQPFWVRIAKRFGKRATYWSAALLHCIGTVSWIFSGPDQPMGLFIARAICVGVSSGGLLLAGQAMLPDAIGEDFRRTGQRREGLFAGIYTTTEKLAQAASLLMIGAALSAMGYVSAQAGGAQTAAVSDSIKWLLLVPACFDLIACVPLIFYKLSTTPPHPAAVEAAQAAMIAEEEPG